MTTSASAMVTGQGNPDPIPDDLVGRVLWAAKHFGIITVFVGVLIYYGNQFITSQQQFIAVQRTENKAQAEANTKLLVSITEKVTEALTRSTHAIEDSEQTSNRMIEIMQQNNELLEENLR